MTITICSSMSFFREIDETREKLEVMGHTVLVPLSTNLYLKDPAHAFNEDLEYCQQHDVLRDHYLKIGASDAVLVLNLQKGKIQGYIGGAVLGEMAVAYSLNKKIFLYNDIPSEEDIRYAFEVKQMKPAVIKGELGAIR